MPNPFPSTSGHELQRLRHQLARDPKMAPELHDFVFRVFHHGQAMSPSLSAQSRVHCIYRLYTEVPPTQRSAPQQQGPQDDEYYLDIGRVFETLVPHMPRRPWFQGYKDEAYDHFKALLARHGERSGGRRLFDDHFYRTFLYFTLQPGSAKCRVYVNTGRQHVLGAAQEIALFVSQNPGPRTGVKFAGPDAIDDRAESVVAYCTSEEAAGELASYLVAQIPSAMLNEAVPAMTVRMGKGISLGREPEMDPVGLTTSVLAVNSFGLKRAELIAMAVENYHASKDALGYNEPPFKTFRRFVCLSFHNFGLDPMKPAGHADPRPGRRAGRHEDPLDPGAAPPCR